MRAKMGSRLLRHGGHEYSFPATSTLGSYDGAALVMIEGELGYLRLNVSEVKKPYPEMGDEIQIKDELTGKWELFTCLDVSPQHAGATIKISYGVKHGG